MFAKCVHNQVLGKRNGPKYNNDFNIVMRENCLELTANRSANMHFFNPLENLHCTCDRENKHQIEVKTQGEHWPILVLFVVAFNKCKSSTMENIPDNASYFIHVYLRGVHKNETRPHAQLSNT
ncbi:hypothetical protein GQX74_000104 [Glossina fuscipes]|nr:hypothetical protein GQX74_000104 [Glossina fuscipes]